MKAFVHIIRVLRAPLFKEVKAPLPFFLFDITKKRPGPEDFRMCFICFQRYEVGSCGTLVGTYFIGQSSKESFNARLIIGT